MAYTPQFNPQPIGNVTVTTPGVPVQLMKNFLTVTPRVAGAVNDYVPCNKINLNSSPVTQGGAGNTGKVYIGTANMVRATLAGVVAVIGVGGGVSITNNITGNIYQFNLWYIDADTAGDGVYGTIDTV